MTIAKLIPRAHLPPDSKALSTLLKFEQLIAELNNKDIPDHITQTINTYVDAVNKIHDGDNALPKETAKYHQKTLHLVSKELKLVSKHYYRNLWMSLGIAAFGIPVGMVIGFALGNIGLLAIGFPFGIVIGIVIGAEMDKKAKQEGKQLNI